MVDVENCFKTALEAVNQASKIVLQGFEGAKTVETKRSSYDLVTEFDRETERYLIQSISKVFPNHKFLAEETTKKEKLTDEPTWIIDPIDGTTNFVHGYPHCVICVALSVKKEIVLGIVANPMLGQTFTAIKGKGAFVNEKPIHSSKVEKMIDALIGLELSLGCFPKYLDFYVDKYKAVIRRAQGIRSVGSAEFSLCMVAMGAWDGYVIKHVQPWDLAAGSIIVTEAGGSVYDTNGGKFDCETGNIVAASTESLAHEIVEVLNE